MFINRLRLAVSDVLRVDPDSIFFYWKGRVALYAILKSIGIREGDEVILPACTCVVVPNAIMYLGAKPVYVDICKETYTLDVSLVEGAITSKTRAIICQNTFGLSSGLDELKMIASRFNIYTIEDCTHGFGGHYNGLPNGRSCDAAFFSTQWNKPFSSGIGGFAITSSRVIYDGLKELDSKLKKPRLPELINLKILYMVRRYLVVGKLYWKFVRTYRFLSRNNLVVGSSSGEEIVGVVKPLGYFKSFSDVQGKEGFRNLKVLDRRLRERKASAEVYSRFLKEKGKVRVHESLFRNHSFLKYPLLVSERTEFMKRAERARIRVGDWFLSPLHPVEGDLSQWGFLRKKYPVASYVSKTVVNLPTEDVDISEVLNFLEQNMDLIL